VHICSYLAEKADVELLNFFKSIFMRSFFFPMGLRFYEFVKKNVELCDAALINFSSFLDPSKASY
jgi:hypothetical protein